MRNWISQKDTVNAQSHKVNRTYSLDKSISERFKRVCFDEGRTQSKQLDILMKRYTEARA